MRWSSLSTRGGCSLLEIFAGKDTLRSLVYRRGKMGQSWVVGATVEMFKEGPCSRGGGILRRPAHQLVSRFPTKGIAA